MAVFFVFLTGRFRFLAAAAAADEVLLQGE